MNILLTAFEPYGDWNENSSWLTLMEFLKDSPANLNLVTRRYPVELQALKERLAKDLEERFDAILHLGQAPGSSSVQLESIALNVACCVEDQGEELPPIEPEGPLAFKSRMPLGRWAELLRAEKIPASVSYHAGTFLCNATMYLSHLSYEKDPAAPFIGFVHLPLATEQVAASQRPTASLPIKTMAQALELLLLDLADCHSALPKKRSRASQV
ncbi:MAG: pyroglutamyl-peptidase I [Planctomycetota bacterium]|nr:pyroglutamyl-peptidase I [Planctomycetota bacterium]